MRGTRGGFRGASRDRRDQKRMPARTCQAPRVRPPWTRPTHRISPSRCRPKRWPRPMPQVGRNPVSAPGTEAGVGLGEPPGLGIHGAPSSWKGMGQRSATGGVSGSRSDRRLRKREVPSATATKGRPPRGWYRKEAMRARRSTFTWDRGPGECPANPPKSASNRPSARGPKDRIAANPASTPQSSPWNSDFSPHPGARRPAWQSKAQPSARSATAARNTSPTAPILMAPLPRPPGNRPPLFPDRPGEPACPPASRPRRGPCPYPPGP